MSLSREEYLTVKNKLEFYISNRIRLVDWKRKRKDKNEKELIATSLHNLNKITEGIISYQLNEEISIEQHLTNIENEFLSKIPMELINEQEDESNKEN